MATGAIREQMIRLRTESYQEAAKLYAGLVEVIGEDKAFLLQDWLAAELRSVEWNNVIHQYNTED